MVELKNKVVIVTGASRGIGKETAIAFAREGCKVVLTARNIDDLKNVGKEIIKFGGDCTVIRADVKEEKQVNDLVNEAFKKYGRIDILVNNAAYGMIGFIEDTPTKDILDMFETNVYSIFYTIKAVLPIMKKQRRGHIINISSVIGKIPTTFDSYYSATKFAVTGFSKAIMMELEPLGIKVSVVYPSVTLTPFYNSMKCYFNKRYDATDTKTPPQKPSDVAKAIIKCAKTQKPEVYPLGLFYLITRFEAIFPMMFRKYILGENKKTIMKKHIQEGKKF